ncbi:MAG: pyridoxamine 5'-phosphate oxidase family protein [Pseudomonadota bacterium]
MNASSTLALPAWHAGEIAMQRTVGMAERMAEIGQRVMRDFMPDQHREFFAQLPFVVLGAVDEAGDAWATVRAGQPGFLHAPDSCRLRVALPREPEDPADAGMEDGDAIAMLGIELHTRRRNRMNGTIRRGAAAGFDVDVVQSFGNCPQYIQLRDHAYVERQAGEGGAEALVALDDEARALISAADAFFVASYVEREDGRRQVDVSHRGGKPGFIKIDEGGTLTVPDFSGNMFFNTLGNFIENPRAGLVFVDFSSGDLLQLSGDVAVLLDAPEAAGFEGAERIWRFTPRRIVRRRAALPLRWAARADGASPAALRTGGWT